MIGLQAAASLELVAREAVADDVGKGRVRLDDRSRTALGVNVGDAVFLEGERRTIAMVARAHPGDEAGIVRLNGTVRRNAGVEVGAPLRVAPARCEALQEVTLQIPYPFPQAVAERLVAQVRALPVAPGDTIAFGLYVGMPPVDVRVAGVAPGSHGLIDGKTRVIVEFCADPPQS